MLALLGTFWRSDIGRPLLVFAAVVGLLVAAFSAFVAWLAVHDGSVERAARAGYVLLAEKTAAEARLAEVERQRAAAAITLDEHRRRLAAAQLLEEQRSTEREREILAYELRLSEANRSCLLSKGDVEFIEKPLAGSGSPLQLTNPSKFSKTLS